jgi:predicted dehydrogenase
MTLTRLMTLDPGHFHAALVQKEMYDGVAPRVDVYAPLGPDLLAHLQRIAGFNARPQRPTAWQLEVHTGPDALERLLRERPGNVVVLSGRNDVKIDRITAAVEAGLHVLADKPWVINAADVPKLESVLARAEERGLVAYDIMTERFEITSILQRELLGDADVFGELLAGSEAEPGIFMESVHFLLKRVAGVPNRRPPWFFDVRQQGEGLTDVGTHLVDLVNWLHFPGQPIDFRKDVHITSSRRWPTMLSQADFAEVTGATQFPAFLGDQVQDGRLAYFCNNLVSYTVRGVHARLDVRWDYQAAAGAGDTHLAVCRGSRSRVEVRQGAAENYRPELYVVPNQAGDRSAIASALQRKVTALHASYPGLEVEDRGAEWRVSIPDSYRVGHEAHFAQVTNQFLRYLQQPRTVPAWERPNMLAKYHVTTQGVQRGR